MCLPGPARRGGARQRLLPACRDARSVAGGRGAADRRGSCLVGVRTRAEARVGTRARVSRLARLLPVPCSTNTGRSGKAAAPVAPAALSAAAEWQRSSGHRSPRSTSIETYSSTRPSVSQASASGHACIGRGEGDFDTARPRLSTARKEARVASASAALPYLALRAASSAGVGGGPRGALAMGSFRPATCSAKSARAARRGRRSSNLDILTPLSISTHLLYNSGENRLHPLTATVQNPQTILTHRLHVTALHYTLCHGLYSPSRAR